MVWKEKHAAYVWLFHIVLSGTKMKTPVRVEEIIQKLIMKHWTYRRLQKIIDLGRIYATVHLEEKRWLKWWLEGEEEKP